MIKICCACAKPKLYILYHVSLNLIIFIMVIIIMVLITEQLGDRVLLDELSGFS